MMLFEVPRCMMVQMGDFDEAYQRITWMVRDVTASHAYHGNIVWGQDYQRDVMTVQIDSQDEKLFEALRGGFLNMGYSLHSQLKRVPEPVLETQADNNGGMC